MQWSWYVWLIGSVAYLNIGYLVMWLTYRNAEKWYWGIDGEYITFKISWNTLLSFPATSTFKTFSDLYDLKIGKQITIHTDDAAFAMLAVSGKGLELYRFAATAAWPLKVIWTIGVLLSYLVFVITSLIGCGLVWIGSQPTRWLTQRHEE